MDKWVQEYHVYDLNIALDYQFSGQAYDLDHPSQRAERQGQKPQKDLRGGSQAFERTTIYGVTQLPDSEHSWLTGREEAKRRGKERDCAMTAKSRSANGRRAKGQ